MALSLGFPPVAVSDCPALCCPDFPLHLERPFSTLSTIILRQNMVGATRLELATSRPPAVRATRLRHAPKTKNPKGLPRLIFPAYMQGGFPHVTSTEVSNIGIPIKMMLGKSFTLQSLRDTLSIPLFYAEQYHKKAKNRIDNTAHKTSYLATE